MRKSKSITKHIKLRYRLTKSDDEYKIICKEINKENNTVDLAEVKILSEKEKAREIFEILVKNEVFPCHLEEIIKELMC